MRQRRADSIRVLERDFTPEQRKEARVLRRKAKYFAAIDAIPKPPKPPNEWFLLQLNITAKRGARCQLCLDFTQVRMVRRHGAQVPGTKFAADNMILLCELCRKRYNAKAQAGTGTNASNRGDQRKSLAVRGCPLEGSAGPITNTSIANERDQGQPVA